jgi:hypothetical protein
MAKFRRLNPGRAAAETQCYTEYAASRGLAFSAAHAAAGPSSSTVAPSSSAPAPVIIDLYDNNDSTNSFYA